LFNRLLRGLKRVEKKQLKQYVLENVLKKNNENDSRWKTLPPCITCH
jgi:hypothetical protein